MLTRTTLHFIIVIKCALEDIISKIYGIVVPSGSSSKMLTM